MTRPNDSETIQDHPEIRGPLIPRFVQIPAAVIIAVPLAWTIWRIASYAWKHADTSPAELQLPEIVLVLVIALALLLLPWQRLGVSVKKIGWLEFDQVVAVQKKESVDSIVALENRVIALERIFQTSAVVQAVPAVQPVTQDGTANDALRDLVLVFLREYRRWYFNAPRIRLWGSKQAGFGKLAEYPDMLIKQELDRLLAAGLVTPRISKSGATLYKAE
jgi:hypothetical protein